jgi:hypothetical protein
VAVDELCTQRTHEVPNEHVENQAPESVGVRKSLPPLRDLVRLKRILRF